MHLQHFGDRVLCRLCLLFARWSDKRHQRDVEITDVVPADIEPELPNRLEERQNLDIANRATDLGYDDIDVVGG